QSRSTVGPKPPPPDPSGRHQELAIAQILAAAFNAAMLFAVAAYILYEGYKRLVVPPEIQSLPMLAIACAGLVVNLMAMRMLGGGKAKSLDIKGAYLGLERHAELLGRDRRCRGDMAHDLDLGRCGRGDRHRAGGCCRGPGRFSSKRSISCWKAFLRGLTWNLSVRL
ncbi:MAG: cation transporter, partial [Hyphomonadaceae bacterium]|nr:cation transporter [Hyphomonadaceae bacterium]